MEQKDGKYLQKDQMISDAELQPIYIAATGGTETTCGNFKIHTFTGPGTFTVCTLSVGHPIGA